MAEKFQPHIDVFYMPVEGFPHENIALGPGEIRPAWVKVEYDRQREQVPVEELGDEVTVEDKPIYLRLQLEGEESKYRHMFELPDGRTHYFLPVEPTYEEYSSFYDQLAPIWEEFEADHEHEQFGEWIASELEELGIDNSAKILMLDHGIGLAGSVLDDKGFSQIDLLTISPKMAEQAVSSMGYDKGSVTSGDLLQHETSEKYDIIVAIQTLQYYREQPHLLSSKLAELLKDDGFVVTSDAYRQLLDEDLFDSVKKDFNTMHIEGREIRRMPLTVVRKK